MILIINNSINNIKFTTWNKQAYNTLKALIGDELIIINNNNEMNEIIEQNSEIIKGVILTGSNLRIVNKNYINKLMDNVLPIIELNVPILGICFGMQILGSIYQSEFQSFQKILKDTVKVNFNTKSELFKNLPKNDLMYVEHNDWLATCPILFNVISHSNGIIYGIEHKKKHVYGIQFHPECSFNKTGLDIYKNFLEICDMKFNNINYTDIERI